MEDNRINAIRDLGDDLALYARAENDKGFFRNFFNASNYDYLRLTLLRANNRQIARGEPPLLTLERFLSVFEEGEELARHDWRLARDLVFIRMVEKLHLVNASDWVEAVKVESNQSNEN